MTFRASAKTGLRERAALRRVRALTARFRVPASGREPDSLAGARLHVTFCGKRGPRVVLLHAIGFDHQTWVRTLPYLQDAYRLALPDLPGHGRSEKPSGVDYGPRAVGRRILQLMDELGWDDAALIGNSIGGGAALSAAVQAPERVRALCLLNSVAYRSGLPAVGRLAAVPFLPLLASYAPRPLVRLGLETVRTGWGSVTHERTRLCGTYLRDPGGRSAFFRMLRQLYGPDLDWVSARLQAVRCPALVLHGAKDTLIRLPHAERLARELPRAELVRLRCGHFPQEERPDEVGPLLRWFLDRELSPGG